MATIKKTTTKSKAVKKTVVKKAGGLSPASQLLIKQPWITEKSYAASMKGQYVFLVDKNTTKPEVKKSIEALYKVTVIGVNTVRSRGKAKHFGSKFTRGSEYKKAIVTLKKGETIDVMPT